MITASSSWFALVAGRRLRVSHISSQFALPQYKPRASCAKLSSPRLDFDQKGVVKQCRTSRMRWDRSAI
jgi:hypothetical protein